MKGRFGASILAPRMTGNGPTSDSRVKNRAAASCLQGVKKQTFADPLWGKIPTFAVNYVTRHQ